MTKELELEGRAREFIRSIQDLRKAKGVHVGDLVDVEYLYNEENRRLLAVYGNYIRGRAGVRELKVGSELKISN